MTERLSSNDLVNALLAILEPLTEREEQVLSFVARGWNNNKIAGELGLSESTIRCHIHNVMQKLHAQNRSEAVYHAILLGIIGRGSRLEGLIILRDRLDWKKQIPS
jgi:DNA-binding NarL/FixJ family response regulator